VLTLYCLGAVELGEPFSDTLTRVAEQCLCVMSPQHREPVSFGQRGTRQGPCGSWSRALTTLWVALPSKVAHILESIEKELEGYGGSAVDRGIRMVVIGQTEVLPASLQDSIRRIEDKTAHSRVLTVCLAVAYSGQVRSRRITLKQNILRNGACSNRPYTK
jgi:hypothetical protein